MKIKHKMRFHSVPCHIDSHSLHKTAIGLSVGVGTVRYVAYYPQQICHKTIAYQDFLNGLNLIVLSTMLLCLCFEGVHVCMSVHAALTACGYSRFNMAGWCLCLCRASGRDCSTSWVRALLTGVGVSHTLMSLWVNFPQHNVHHRYWVIRGGKTVP